jgi:murein DD-endopeptidase MepM/ murein hydrolase activator NlpD
MQHAGLQGLPYFVLVVISMVLVYGGYQIGQKQSAPITQMAEWRSMVSDQQSSLAQTKQEINANLDALTQRVGLLQAHLNRINALGSRLVNMADLDSKEFDFLKPPAMGGPDSPEGAVSPESFVSEEIERVLDLLELQLLEKEQQLSLLDEVILNKTMVEKTKPEGSPVVDGWMSSGYGYRSDPFSGRRLFHQGIDFAGAEGGPIFSVAGGIVSLVESHPQYGNMVEIDHGNGYMTRYAHASKVLVSEGQIVKRGQQIAEIGSTGRSTGPHVHFEVLREGQTVNPSAMVGG